MNRHSAIIALWSLFTLAGVTAHAGEPKKEPPSLKEEMAAIFRTEVQKIETRIESLNKDLTRKLDDLRDNATLLKADVIQLQRQQSELRSEIVTQKARLDQLIDEQRKLTLNSSPIDRRISNYGPNSPVTGRVMLVNLYSEPVVFTVNNVEHIVPAGRSKPLEGVPSGTVSYDVFANRHGFLDRQTIMLLPGETYTLTVFPRR